MLKEERLNNNKKNSDSKQKFYINNQIRSSEVLCIDHNDEKIGIIPTRQALEMARENDLDLVQIAIADGIPTCKILDYGKFKFNLSKKQKAAAKRQREQASKIKEIKFRPSTDTNDLQTKARQANAFLADGHKLKISIMFKGRELSHKEVAYDTLDEFLEMLPGIQIIKDATIEGRSLSVMAGLANP